MVESAEVQEFEIDEERLIEKVHELMAVPEKERNEYVRRVIEALTESLDRINRTKGLIKKKKLVEKFAEDLKEHGDEVMVALIYSVKPEFRRVYIRMLKVFSGLGS